MGKKKLVLDTNILISALGWKGNENAVIIDLNHPLAGKELMFKIKVVAIN